MNKNGLVMEDAYNREKWQVVKSITIRNPANSVNGEEAGSKLNRWWWSRFCPNKAVVPVIWWPKYADSTVRRFCETLSLLFWSAHSMAIFI